MTASSTKVVAFACMHAAGEHPPLISLPCSGRLDAAMLLYPFVHGAAGVLVCSCSPRECIHQKELPGGEPGHGCAEAVSLARQALASAGLSPSRIALRSVSPSEDPGLYLNEYQNTVDKLGPWSDADAAPFGVADHTDGDRDRVAFALWCAATIQSKKHCPKPAPAHEATKVLLWSGCVRLRRGLTGLSTDERFVGELLKKVGVTATIVPDRCCGQPLLTQPGSRDDFVRLAEANAQVIKESGATQILTSCTHCARVLQSTYPDYGVSIDVPVTDVATWGASVLLPEAEAASPLNLAIASPCDEFGATSFVQAIQRHVSVKDHLFWPGCGETLEGPSLRRGALALAGEAHARGAEAAVLPCTHCETKARAVMGLGAWQGGPPLDILGGLQALEALLSSSHPKPAQ